ncbi:MAG: periplasmic heavy metal sensor [Terriglobia bacterium]|jgi:Spy/CpxP family protein refolding chaperone
MKALRFILGISLFLAPLVLRAQNNPHSAPQDIGEAPPEPIIAQSQSETIPPPPPGRPMIRTERRIVGGPGPIMSEPLGGGEFGPGGAWWKNSEIVSKLQLSEEQVKKISQTFLDHKLKLIDLQADLEKHELRLQPLMDIDQPDESKVGAQIDLITEARGRLEKENAMMMLDIRRWLSVDQWKKLKSLDSADEGKRKSFFFREIDPRGGPGINIEVPLPPPLPDDMPVMKH